MIEGAFFFSTQIFGNLAQSTQVIPDPESARNDTLFLVWRQAVAFIHSSKENVHGSHSSISAHEGGAVPNETLLSVHGGDSILDLAVTDKVIRRATRPGTEPALTGRLTPREREVLRLMAAGDCNAEIPEHLCLAEGTVKNYVSHILGKLGARDRADAVRLTVEWGLLDE